jgi:hypothetical protein
MSDFGDVGKIVARGGPVAEYSGWWGGCLYTAIIEYEYELGGSGHELPEPTFETLKIILEDGEKLSITVYRYGNTPMNGVYDMLRGLIEVEPDNEARF